MRTYQSYFDNMKKTKQKKEEESLEAIFELYFMPVEKSKWTTTAIIIWSMCLGALIVYLVSCL